MQLWLDILSCPITKLHLTSTKEKNRIITHTRHVSVIKRESGKFNRFQNGVTIQILNYALYVAIKSHW